MTRNMAAMVHGAEFECPDVTGEDAEDADKLCLELERVEIDDTADIDTVSTVDYEERERRFVLSGDFRALANHLDRTNRAGEDLTETTGQARVRMKASARLSTLIGVGARLAGRCSSDDCDLEWVSGRSPPTQSGLEQGQFTFDEM